MPASNAVELITGSQAVSGYEEYSQTPHGRLRHDLLYLHYHDFIQRHGVTWVCDVGGGSGLLIKRLLTSHPQLRVALMDADLAMVEKARVNLQAFASQVHFVHGSADDFPRAISEFARPTTPGLVSFNHTIEYVPDQISCLKTLALHTPRNSYLGIMYLNNSQEALRHILHKDSISGLRSQLADYSVDMGHFGKARAMDSKALDDCLTGAGMRRISDCGFRSVAEFKSREFVQKYYDELLRLEYELGNLPDFVGLARYRLKFFGY